MTFTPCPECGQCALRHVGRASIRCDACNWYYDPPDIDKMLDAALDAAVTQYLEAKASRESSKGMLRA